MLILPTENIVHISMSHDKVKMFRNIPEVEPKGEPLNMDDVKCIKFTSMVTECGKLYLGKYDGLNQGFLSEVSFFWINLKPD